MEALPRPIESQLEGRRVTKIAAGHSHAAAITADGELFIWGSNIFLEPQAFPSLLHSKVSFGCRDIISLVGDGFSREAGAWTLSYQSGLIDVFSFTCPSPFRPTDG